ncbi:uncharacterized protein [Solanum lycopersicum]|uniref:uncharacterized protein n=1 Tax=Solanum lycopersicum TaxID=4081 RepID=UPI003749C21C
MKKREDRLGIVVPKKSESHQKDILIMYCDKLVGVGRDERILMKLFMRSLTGEALSWYIEQDSRKWIKWVDMATDFMNRFGFNIKNAPDWFYIQNLKKKPSESFREYAIRWRSEAARAKPPMEESQMKDYFIRAQEPQYYDRMMLVAEKSFDEIIKLGKRIEEGIKNGTIINLEALQATNKALQSGGMIESRKKAGSAGYVSQILALPVDVRAKWYDPNKVCAYHSGMKGHTTEVCRALKDKVQMLIDTKTIQLKDPTPNVANNPLPNHQFNMVEAGDVWDWEESIWAVEKEEAMSTTAQAPLIVHGLAPFEVEVAAPRPPFAVYKASSPIQCDIHVVPWDYNKTETNVEETDVATRLSKTPSQISILELLQSSETHRDALLKILGEACVPSNITHGEYQDKVINKALVDAGSGLNICPLSTLTRLGVDSAKIQTWKMNVRAFDGSQSGTIGEITLDMLIGPVTFPIALQILDIPSSYNLLLGRPWIHMAGAVPSTLHQCLMFEWDYEEVVVHGEKGHPVYTIE